MDMRIKRHYLGAAIAALTVAAFAGSAFANDSGRTGALAVQDETSLTTAPAEPSGDTAATEQTNIASDTSTSSTGGSGDATRPASGTTGGASGWTVAGSSSPGTTAQEPTPPTETNGSGSSPQGNGSTEAPTTDAPVTCPSKYVTGASFSIGSTAATATFSIANGCEGVQVTLASYTTPDPQKLFDSSGGSFSAGGPYTLTVNLPNCFFQIDLVAGPAPGVINSPFAIVIGAVGRVGTVCVETPPPPPPPPPPPTTTTTTTTTTAVVAGTTTTSTTTTPTTTTVAPTTTTPGNVAGEQANNSGNTNVLGVAANVAALPFTGLSLMLIAVLGAFLLLLGVGLKLAARRGAKR
jgi:hypothetical protein